jgi:hypothetical protein
MRGCHLRLVRLAQEGDDPLLFVGGHDCDFELD